MEIEIWKDIPGYEGSYQASNLGRIKSMPRLAVNRYGLRPIRERILKQNKSSSGYLMLGICLDGVVSKLQVHQLIVTTFLNHKSSRTLVVDHIDGDRTNNHLCNLRIVTNRENGTTCSVRNKDKHTSKYAGVCRSTGSNKWLSSISINGKRKHLGIFVNEIDAHNAYQNELKMLG